MFWVGEKSSEELGEILISYMHLYKRLKQGGGGRAQLVSIKCKFWVKCYFKMINSDLANINKIVIHSLPKQCI